MNKVTLAIVWILLPASIFGQQRLFPATGPQFATIRNHTPESTSFPPFRLFPDPDRAGQSSATGPLASSSSARVNTKTRPHLIELSSANWRPLTESEKFAFFWRDLLHWGTHASIAFDTGLSYATADRSFLGTGARGFFTRYGLNAADEANFTFFNAFFFPTLFHQDPRYIPADNGRTTTRLTHALSRIVITRGDSGKSQVNVSRLLGDFVATSISSIMFSCYGADIGVGGNFADYGINLATDAAFDVFKEFWPDVARKMKLNLWLRNIVRGALRDYVRG
jgi:hypothetical protein